MEAQAYVKEYIDTCHQQWWDRQKSEYKQIQPIVSRRPFHTAYLRSHETVMARLLLERCRLNATLFRMGCHPTGLCDACGVPETVFHFLMGCVSPLAVAICGALPNADIPLAEILTNKQIETIICK